MASFNSYVSHYQRVPPDHWSHWTVLVLKTYGATCGSPRRPYDPLRKHPWIKTVNIPHINLSYCWWIPVDFPFVGEVDVYITYFILTLYIHIWMWYNPWGPPILPFFVDEFSMNCLQSSYLGERWRWWVPIDFGEFKSKPWYCCCRYIMRFYPS